MFLALLLPAIQIPNVSHRRNVVGSILYYNSTIHHHSTKTTHHHLSPPRKLLTSQRPALHPNHPLSTPRPSFSSLTRFSHSLSFFLSFFPYLPHSFPQTPLTHPYPSFKLSLPFPFLPSFLPSSSITIYASHPPISPADRHLHNSYSFPQPSLA